jgi:hypothetical protein
MNRAELTDRDPHFLARSERGSWERLKALLLFNKLRVSLEIPAPNEVGQKALVRLAVREIAVGTHA